MSSIGIENVNKIDSFLANTSINLYSILYFSVSFNFISMFDTKYVSEEVQSEEDHRTSRLYGIN